MPEHSTAQVCGVELRRLGKISSNNEKGEVCSVRHGYGWNPSCSRYHPIAAPHPTRGRITSMVKAPEALTDVGDFAKDTEVFTPSLTRKGEGESERAQTPSKPLNN